MHDEGEFIMKATGIVRRIDELGRVVVPKEIRRTLKIREGDPLEIYTDHEGGVILKKYSPIGELGKISSEYAESVAQVAKCTVCVTDKDIVVAAAGPARKEFMGKSIHNELVECIAHRENILATQEDARFCQITSDRVEVQSEAVGTIISDGAAIGAVILLSQNREREFTDLERKLAVCGAAFLGRQMEE